MTVSLLVATGARAAKCDVAQLVATKAAFLALDDALEAGNRTVSGRQIQIVGSPPILQVTFSRPRLRPQTIFFAAIPGRRLFTYNLLANRLGYPMVTALIAGPDAISPPDLLPVLQHHLPGLVPAIPVGSRLYGFVLPQNTSLFQQVWRWFPELKAAEILVKDPDNLSEARATLSTRWPTRSAQTELIRRIQNWSRQFPGIDALHDGRFLAEVGLNEVLFRSIARFGLIGWLAGAGSVTLPLGVADEQRALAIPIFSEPGRPEDFRLTIPNPTGTDERAIVLRLDFILNAITSGAVQTLLNLEPAFFDEGGFSATEREALLQRIADLARRRNILPQRIPRNL